MSDGSIQVAEHEGVHVLKLIGDVRLTFSVALDKYISTLLNDNVFCAILFDLTEADLLDSTTLGLIAKIAIRSFEQKGHKPLLVCQDESINRLLDSMGITDVCQILDELPDDYCSIDLQGSLKQEGDEDDIKARVLEAHCVLMGLNEANKETFKDLVASLKDD